MTPHQFVTKWRASTLGERQGAQQHFLDLCAVLNEPPPSDPDSYCFEAGVGKAVGGRGWADVWKKGCFAWEYKGKGKDLTAAYVQLVHYAGDLQNPPLLVVSDMDTIRIRTAFTNAIQQVHTITLDTFGQPENLQLLKRVFSDPESLRPAKTRESLTADAAGEFSALAQMLHNREFEPRRVAHFINKIVFCMFAEDIGILPKGVFTRTLDNCLRYPSQFAPMIRGLFGAMKEGGLYGAEVIDWFNGGLFDDDDVLPLDSAGIRICLDAAKLDWSQIEPSIFGTLFERGLDPSKRSQLGAHYTDRGSIMRIVEPVVLQPLRAEWDQVKQQIQGLLASIPPRTANSPRTKKLPKPYEKAVALYHDFLYRLQHVRVLDPACGSGNFLYLALRGLKDLEQRVILDAEHLGLPAAFPSVGPECVMGIEISPYAAELARLTI